MLRLQSQILYERKSQQRNVKSQLTLDCSQASKCQIMHQWFIRSQMLNFASSMTSSRRKLSKSVIRWPNLCMPCVSCKRLWTARTKMWVCRSGSLRPRRRTLKRLSIKSRTNSSKIYHRHKARLMFKAIRIRVSPQDRRVYLENNLDSDSLSKRQLVLVLKDLSQTCNLGLRRILILNLRKA